MVCRECWEADHPQLMLGMYPVDDPQALRNPRPDRSYAASRDTQWGWNPVGAGGPNNLESVFYVGSVNTITGRIIPIPVTVVDTLGAENDFIITAENDAELLV